MLNIPVVCGSVRQTRKGIYVANFLAEKLTALGQLSQVVDFTKLPLPFMYAEPPVSLKGKYPDPNVQAWSAIALAADAFVLVAPEYNHGYSGVLKNALDWLYPEFYGKAAALVGVSSGSLGGVRAVEQLRPIMDNFAMFAIRETLLVKNVESLFGEKGKLLDESFSKQADKVLAALIKAAEATQALRKTAPAD